MDREAAARSAQEVRVRGGQDDDSGDHDGQPTSDLNPQRFRSRRRQ